MEILSAASMKYWLCGRSKTDGDWAECLRWSMIVIASQTPTIGKSNTRNHCERIPLLQQSLL